MSAHWFITSPDFISPRWPQAFEQAQVVYGLPEQVDTTDMVWLLLQDEQRLGLIQTLSAQGIKVVAMTALENALEARHSLEAGAYGYVHYLAAPELLRQIEQVIAAGGLWLGAELMRQLVSASARILHAHPTSRESSPVSSHIAVRGPADGAQRAAGIALLSAREKSVADLVARGKSNKEVARELNITERTVKAHLSAVFDKLHVRDRLQLVLVLSSV